MGVFQCHVGLLIADMSITNVYTTKCLICDLDSRTSEYFRPGYLMVQL